MISNSLSLTIKDILNIVTHYLRRKGVDNSRLVAEILLSSVLHLRREELYLNYNNRLNKGHIKHYWSLIKRRVRGEPVQYITGKKEFWSLEFDVNPSVLIPRPETEILVEHAINSIKDIKNPYILDIGTGSGVIAITMAKVLSDARIWALDVSDKAIETAIHNAKKHGVMDKINFLQGDLWQPLRDRDIKFHLIVTNPPYVSEREYEKLPKEIKQWEPKIALNGGIDGLSLIRRIIKETAFFLRYAGWIFMEISSEQAAIVIELFKETGQFSSIDAIKDYSHQFRIVKARKE